MPSLDELLQQRTVYRGRQLAPPAPVRPSGFAPLDRVLGGGLPAVGVNRLQSPTGIGELRLLLPYLLAGPTRGKLLVFINPPGRPYPDFWYNAGVDLNDVQVLHTTDTKQALWSAEQCLQSGCCLSVLLWQNNLEVSQLKRLQLAAIDGGASLWWLQPPRRENISLPLHLSLLLQASSIGIQATITKRKGGWATAPITLDWRERWPEQTIAPLPANVRPLPSKRRRA